MAAIDQRLLDCDGEQEVTENFNRVLDLIDGLKQEVTENFNRVLDLIDGLNVYTVTFNSDGGSSVGSQYVLIGRKVTEPTAPTKTGYTFGGWKNGDAEWDFDVDTVAANTTLTAQWTAEG